MDKSNVPCKFRVGDHVIMSAAAAADPEVSDGRLVVNATRHTGIVVACLRKLVRIRGDDGAERWYKCDHWELRQEMRSDSDKWLEHRAMVAAFRRD